MAKVISASGLYKLTHAQAFTLMMLAQSKGLSPIQAMERYHIVNGRPAMRADAMLAEFQANRGTVEWTVDSDTVVEGVFRHPVQAPNGNVSRFTLEDAQKAGLIAQNPVWVKYPGNMLRARVISNGVRKTLPGIVMGIYTPEEVADFEPAPPPRQATARVVEAPAPVARVIEAVAHEVAPPPAPAKPAKPPKPPKAEPHRLPAETAKRLHDLMVRAEMDEYEINAALLKRGVDRIVDLTVEQATVMINKLEGLLSVEEFDPLGDRGKEAPAEVAQAPRKREPGDDDEPFDDATGEVIVEDGGHERREIDAEFDRPIAVNGETAAAR